MKKILFGDWKLVHMKFWTYEVSQVAQNLAIETWTIKTWPKVPLLAMPERIKPEKFSIFEEKLEEENTRKQTSIKGSVK
jgi:hypothetical protein